MRGECARVPIPFTPTLSPEEREKEKEFDYWSTRVRAYDRTPLHP